MTAPLDSPNSDTVKHESGFAKKMRKQDKQSVDDAIYGAMPDYTLDEFQWTQRIKSMMAGKLKHRKIFNRDSQDRIIHNALALAKQNGAMGDILKTWRCFGRVYRTYQLDRRKYKSAEKQLADYARLNGLTDDELRRVRAIQHPGSVESTLDFYLNEIDKFAQKTTGRRQVETQSFLDAQSGTFKASPITNPNPKSAEQLAELKARAEAAEAKLKQDAAKHDGPEQDEPAQQPESELDKAFGKKPSKRPVVNPGNWTHDTNKRNKFYAELQEKGWNKYGIPGPQKSKHIHTALGVNSLHETNLSPDVALVTVLVYLDKLFGKKDEAVTAPETTEITKEQWIAWLDEHNWNKKPFVLTALDAYSVENGKGPVTKLGEWAFDLDIAEIVVDDFLDAQMEKTAQQASESDEKAAEQPAGQDAPPVVQQPPKPSATNGNKPPAAKKQFKKATANNSKLRLAIGGVPGGGKTYTGLQIARELLPDGKIAVIDTESGSASKFAKLFDFDVLELDTYTPESYIDAIHLAEDEGYDLLIIDSLSHEWDSETGVLAIVDDLKKRYRTKDGAPDTWACWREASPRHQALIQTILNSKIHVIATMRCKWDVVKERDENRRVVTKKVIGSLVQREKIEFEFDIVVKADEFHNLVVDKSRCPALDGWSGNKDGKEIARRVSEWLTAA